MEGTSSRGNVSQVRMRVGSSESSSNYLIICRYVPPKEGDMVVTKALLGLFFDTEIKALE